eukprot:TRINITY_DN19371_c0_g4_i1.p1 TRINITY_DN19371_c0_g4~~TRINITY_DN19371_c0_g4_i1.p1  ORF type:complete len:440 (-),score=142.11 TRINITY_DN19371_c0_g4_i1:106-1425(-)
MAEDDDFKEELQRRLAKIAELREEVWAARDRIEEAEARAESLRQGLSKRQAEIAIRRAKANEMEDTVALREGEGVEAKRRHAATAVARAEEVDRLQQDIDDEDESYSIAAEAAAEERRCADAFDCDLEDGKARLQQLRREVERVREEQARVVEQKQAQAARARAEHEKEVAAQREAAVAALEASSRDVASARSRTEIARAGLEVTRTRCGVLQESLAEEEKQHQEMERTCVAYELQLQGLDETQRLEQLTQSLEERRREQAALAKQVADSKSETDMRVNGIQGALEETTRMMQEHLEQTRRVPMDPALATLQEAFAEARRSADAAAAAAKVAERERLAFANDVARAEGAAKAAEFERDERERRLADAMSTELAAARRALEEAERREHAAAESADRACCAMAEVEQNLAEREKFLRAKLNELWQPLRFLNTFCLPQGGTR